MAIERIYIDQFLELAKKNPVLDVRSPAEYNHAHLTGAISLPLFTDEERKIVGTTYKQKSREEAIKAGLDFFGPKMKPMLEEAERIADSSTQSTIANLKSKILLIYCWRGGMRSAGVAWLLDLYGFKVFTLAGGYKSFRKMVLETFKQPFSFRILGGYTGSDKTGLLHALEKQGETVIDLEGLANHKGSAFGNIGMPAQPGQEMFENLLAIELIKKTEVRRSVVRRSVERSVPAEIFTDPLTPDPLTPSIWLEDESQRIGQLNIPGHLWANMRQSPLFFVDLPFEERLQHIVQEYGQLEQQKLVDAIGRISEKLGGLKAKMAISLLKQGEITESFRILLEYYDRHYFKALHNRKGVNSLLHTIECKSIIPENAIQLIRLSKQQYQKA